MATTLISGKKSTYGRPYCYYTMKASASRTSNTVASVTISWSCHLAYSDSLLGSGRILNAGVYCGGAWYNKQIKGSSSSWSGTGTHSGSWSFNVDVTALDTAITISNVRVLRGDSYSDASQLNSTSVNKTLEIPQGASATIPTLSTNELVLGNALTITTQNDITTFTHALSYTIGSLTTEQTIASDVVSGYTWTVPIDGIAQYINSDTVEGTLNIYCSTYDGNTLIGTESVSLTVIIPETNDTKPTINAPTITEGNILFPSAFTGNFVQSFSMLNVAQNISGKYNATITNCVTTIEDIDYEGITSITSDIILGSGNIPILITATDSRGFTNTYTATATIVAYNTPIISGLVVAQTSGKINVKASGSVSPVNNLNTISATVYYKKIDASSYSTVAITTSNYAFTNQPGDISISGLTVSEPVEVKVVLTDATTSTEKIFTTNLSVDLAKSQFGYIAIPTNGNVYQMPYDLPIYRWKNNVDVDAPSDIAGMILDSKLNRMIGYTGSQELVYSPVNLFNQWTTESAGENIINQAQAFNKVICLGASKIYWYDSSMVKQSMNLPSITSGSWKYIVGNDLMLFVIGTNGSVAYINSLSDTQWSTPIYQADVDGSKDLGNGILLTDIAPISDGQFNITPDALIGLVLSKNGWKFIKTPIVSYR